ncbi:MAG TPA: preprotein translocase subunit TatB [Rugosimonospora sp.]|nr:preprotein translocase subunit TatB [Rugosimonospora sp.]
MFGLENLDGWKLLVLLLLGIFIFGPDKLPKAIADGVRMLRNVRDMARNATSDLSRELGTDIQLEDLNPKALIRKHLLSEEDEQALRKPLEDLARDVQADVKGLTAEIKDSASSLELRSRQAGEAAPAVPVRPVPRVIDGDAT